MQYFSDSDERFPEAQAKRCAYTTRALGELTACNRYGIFASLHARRVAFKAYSFAVRTAVYMEQPTGASPPQEAAPELPQANKGCKRVATQKPPRRKKGKPETAVADSTNSEEPTPREVVLAYMRQQNRPYNLQLVSRWVPTWL